MKAHPVALLIGLLGCAVPALAADGLSVPMSALQHWQARVAVSASDTSPRLAAVSLVGDYYFQGQRLGSPGASGGFRATSGLVYGAGFSLLGATGVSTRAIAGVSPGHLARSPLTPGLESNDAGSAVPYLGLGYTRITSGAGLSFSADFGLVAQNPAAAASLGEAVFGTRALDAAIRNLRLRPVLQLGVRYTF